MVRAVSRSPFTAEAQFRVRVIPCGICGRRNGSGTSFSPRFSVFPCEYHYTTALHTYVGLYVEFILLLSYYRLCLSSGFFLMVYPTKSCLQFSVSPIIFRCPAHRNLLHFTVVTTLGDLYKTPGSRV